MKTPQEVVSYMLSNDAFSKWMQIKLNTINLGTCELQTTIHADMLNGFEILHGGISYSLSDSALAFAANSYGFKCVSIESSISHLRPVKNGDILTAHAKEINRGKTIGVYEVTILNQDDKKVSHFKGTVHISQEIW
ncbi:MAG: hotdog fold thioesterase [Crocinitomicaceae bacterium]|jgi:acyl-CoA thioesterase|nr:hotdog fold thioesterase [Crocinitomicaceae bacterium]MCF8433724.1 hotdog fold thioesterase [Crocinitomicaceae bacterium]